MSKKVSLLLSKLWKMTAFHIFAQPGKQQSNFIHDGFQNILNAYGVFQNTVLTNIQQLRTTKLNIPALVKIKLQLTKSRARIEKFIKQESETIGHIVNVLSQFKFFLQKSQLNATKEYSEKMNYFLTTKEEGMSARKIQRIHEDFMGLNIKEKNKIRNSPKSSKFEKWLTDFYIRSEQFFMKAYSSDWEQQSQQNRSSFFKLKTEDELTPQLFKQAVQPTIEQQLPQALENKNFRSFQEVNIKLQDCHHELRKSQMDEQQNDIVSQIFKELQKVTK